MGEGRGTRVRGKGEGKGGVLVGWMDGWCEGAVGVCYMGDGNRRLGLRDEAR